MANSTSETSFAHLKALLIGLFLMGVSTCFMLLRRPRTPANAIYNQHVNSITTVLPAVKIKEEKSHRTS